MNISVKVFAYITYFIVKISQIASFPPLVAESKAKTCAGLKLYGHHRITEIALRSIARSWFLENPNVGTDDEKLSDLEIGDDKDGLNLMIWHYQHKVNSPLKKSIPEAFKEIENANSEIDGYSTDALRKFSQNARFHFDAEEFNLSNAEIANRLEKSIAYIQHGNYSTARMLIGQALHILQDFYSHSNWIEMQIISGITPLNIYPNIGRRDTQFRVAPKHMSTCEYCDPLSGKCNEPQTAFVPMNTTHGFLTSGYFEHKDYGPRKMGDRSYNTPKPGANVTKCSHGGSYDASRKLNQKDGVNKDFPIEKCRGFELSYAPHTALHQDAAKLAIQATVAFLDSVRNNVSDAQFGAFLGIDSPESVSSLGLVIDTTGSTDPIHNALKKQLSRIIERAAKRRETVKFVLVPFNDPAFGPPLETTNVSEVNSTLYSLEASGGDDPAEMCYPALLMAVKKVERRTPVFVFTEEESKERDLKDEILREALKKDISIYFLIVHNEKVAIDSVWENCSELRHEEEKVSQRCLKPHRKRRSAAAARVSSAQNKAIDPEIESKYRFYSQLAHNTGGQVFTSSNDVSDISDTASVMDFLTSSNRVLLFKYVNISCPLLLQKQHVFPVEPNCTNVNVLISGPIGSSGLSFTVRHEHESTQTSSSIIKITDWMLNVIIPDPRPGNWAIIPNNRIRVANYLYQISVFCDSDFEVSIKFHTLQQTDSELTFANELEGPPIANSTLLLSATGSLDSIILNQLIFTDSETDHQIGSHELRILSSLPDAHSAEVTIPAKAFNVRVVGRVRGTNFDVSRVLPAAVVPVSMNLDFSVADDYPNTIEAGRRTRLVATLTNIGAPHPLSVRLHLHYSDPALLTSDDVIDGNRELSDRVTSVQVGVRASRTLAEDAVVWVEASVSEVRGLGSLTKRVYLFLKRKPDPSTPKPRTVTKSTPSTARTTTLPAQTRINAGHTGLPNASEAQTTRTPNARTASAGRLRCIASATSYTAHCVHSKFALTSAHCGAFSWNAQFTLEEGAASLTRVRLTSRALPFIDTNDAKKPLDEEARAKVRTNWSRGRGGSGPQRFMYTYEYNVSASCCLYELRLYLSDELNAHANCTLVNRELLPTTTPSITTCA